MKVVIIGGHGQLGVALARRMQANNRIDTVVAGHKDLDICQAAAVAEMMNRVRPRWVINCAAYTDVDGAELNSELAFEVNDRAVGTLADASVQVGARLVHISTDYVFSGDFGEADPRSYTEEDATGPVNVYGESKLAGEIRLLDRDPSALILRSSWLYGGRDRNFLRTMLRLGEERRSGDDPLRIVDDQRGTPTDCWSLARQIARLLEDDIGDLRGIVHASCEGETTWCEFAREIFAQLGWDVRVEPITTSEFASRARRPANSVLENARLKQHGLLEFPAWREGLAHALQML